VASVQNASTEATLQQASTSSSKRRRLSSAGPTTELLRTPATSASVRTTRNSSRREDAIFTIAEDGGTEPHNSPLRRTDEATTGSAITQPTATNEIDPEKENELTDENEAGLDLGLESSPHLLKSNNPLAVGLESVSIEAEGHEDVKPSVLADLQPDFEIDQQSDQPSNITEPLLESINSRATKQQKRRRRTAIAVPRKKKRLSGQPSASNESTLSITQTTESRAQSEDHDPVPDITATLEAEESRELDSSPKPSRPTSPASRRDVSPVEMDDEGDKTYIQGTPEPPTPAPRRKLTKPQVKQKPSRDPQAPARSKSSRPTFPILTHRMTNISTLPTIHEEIDHHSQRMDDGRLGMDVPAERSQPNVVDVLAQICREMITNLLDNMPQNVPRSERTAAKTKRSALEAFGEDLNEELFQMSEAVENRTDLEARVRKSKREKSSLQAEYIEIRRQREQIALKCDSVRRRHWECEQDTREKWNISEAARRIELDVARAEGESHESVEFLLRSVTNNVSHLADAGGILDKTKAFNAQLESMALMLEKR